MAESEFLPVAKPDLSSLEEEYVLEAVRSGWVSSIGAFVARFEEEFAASVGCDFAVSASNGTDALFLTLRALGVGAGHEVIVPSVTFVAVASAVVRAGAVPVFVDIHPDYWCIDPAAVGPALSDRTRAVIAVHSYGHPADMDELARVTAPRGIPIIEDAAEAHAARYKGRTVGGIGAAGCFSFYGNKIITTGEGGMITTNDADLADRVRYLKDHAMDKGRYYYHSELGYNCRMTNLQAALGCAQLKRYPELLSARAEILEHYRNALADQPWLTLNPNMAWAEPVNWLIAAVGDRDGDWRDACMAFLRDSGIDSRPFFYPLNELPPYRIAPPVALPTVIFPWLDG